LSSRKSNKLCNIGIQFFLERIWMHPIFILAKCRPYLSWKTRNKHILFLILINVDNYQAKTNRPMKLWYFDSFLRKQNLMKTWDIWIAGRAWPLYIIARCWWLLSTKTSYVYIFKYNVGATNTSTIQFNCILLICSSLKATESNITHFHSCAYPIAYMF